MIHRLNETFWFRELRPDKPEETPQPDRVQAIAVVIPPRDCSRVVKTLDKQFPLPKELGHLKRVRKKPWNNSGDSQSSSQTITTTKQATQAISSPNPTQPDNNNNNNNNNHDNSPVSKRLKREESPTQQASSKGIDKALADNMESAARRKKQEVQLQVLLCLANATSTAETEDQHNVSKSDLPPILQDQSLQAIFFNKGPGENAFKDDEESKNQSTASFSKALVSVIVPGRPPQSQEEANEMKQIWPIQFYPKQSNEYQEEQLALSQDEMTFMNTILQRHILPDQDKKEVSNNVAGMKEYFGAPPVVIVDPKQERVVSTSAEEGRIQFDALNKERKNDSILNKSSSCHIDVVQELQKYNPLITPLLLAVQGVSRLERLAVQTKTLQDFAKGQYLCNGYDVYCGYEPTVYEAMACVHSRIRRLIYLPGDVGHNPRPHGSISSQSWQARHVCWRGGLSKHGIHSLPGVNHHYRVFAYCHRENSSQESSS